MKHLLLSLLLGLTYTLTIGQNENLETRVNKFYKVEEDSKISKEDKIRSLKEYIIPGASNDSMAIYFYNSWSKSFTSTKKLKTKLLDIHYFADSNKALVTTEDIVTYLDGEKITYTSKTIWIKLNEIWYRDDKKSELYQDGVRIR